MTASARSASLLQTFTLLHSHRVPLLLPNAWDAASAALLQMAGAPAIATSSAALAWSLGYADGGALPRAALLHAVEGIMRVSKVPVSVDIEDGYSHEPRAVAALVADLLALGVVGINLEDGCRPPALLVDKIGAIRASASSREVFINARTDVYLRDLAAGERP
ncbi:isocitrate lyase/phosphoenolpyruvate mutase family protein [Shewanella sp. AS16]|uniref:isocitrate lyase/phosphoenolpyruvate mutase family protein n=1 Tax=Shewanella sp. AS16 TaxID=2907625 RepID=UPI0022781DEE|nr:isocitrate lyase/phosphoenolpyruvate mutase family protein [Shewanella sp. AS16]